MSKSPIDRAIDDAVHCVKCGALGVGKCGCWIRLEHRFVSREDFLAALRSYLAGILQWDVEQGAGMLELVAPGPGRVAAFEIIRAEIERLSPAPTEQKP